MLVEIRIYRRHDADLISLLGYQVNISKMMRLALENYVAGERIKFRLPQAKAFNLKDKTMFRYRLNIKNPKVIALLKSVKKGYRNQFCKALLRDMLDAVPLSVYLDKPALIRAESERLSEDALVAGGYLGSVTKREQLDGTAGLRKRKEAEPATAKKEEATGVRARAASKPKRQKAAADTDARPVIKERFPEEELTREVMPAADEETAEDAFAGLHFDMSADQTAQDDEMDQEQRTLELARMFDSLRS